MTREKSPNVHKSCPKIISLEKLKNLAHTQKLPKTVGGLGKLIVAKGFKKLPKVQKIAKSGHTAHNTLLLGFGVYDSVKTSQKAIFPKTAWKALSFKF